MSMMIHRHKDVKKDKVTTSKDIEPKAEKPVEKKSTTKK